jgi:hypothetical protein
LNDVINKHKWVQFCLLPFRNWNTVEPKKFFVYILGLFKKNNLFANFYCFVKIFKFLHYDTKSFLSNYKKSFVYILIPGIFLTFFYDFLLEFYANNPKRS